MLSKRLKAFLVVAFVFVLSGCSGFRLADSVEEHYYHVLDFPKKEVFDAVVAVFPHYGFIVQSEGVASGKIIGASKQNGSGNVSVPRFSWEKGSFVSANIKTQPGAVGGRYE